MSAAAITELVTGAYALFVVVFLADAVRRHHTTKGKP